MNYFYLDSVDGRHDSMAPVSHPYPLPPVLPRSDNVIVVSQSSPQHQKEFEGPVFKKQKILASSMTNPPSNNLLESGMPPLNPPSRNVSTLFFKTKICQRFMSGSCHFGSSCCFAHGDKELRRPPPNWQYIVAEEQGRSSDQQRLPKGGICRMFDRDGVCTYGDKCIYSHIERERSIGVGSIAMAQRGVSGSTDNEVFPSPHNGSLRSPASFKKKPCFKWQTTGHCFYGENCIYAHGDAELKNFGGYPELEKAKIVEAPSRHLPTIPESPSQYDPTGGHHVQDKGFLKLKKNSKIAGIYGDWLDEN